ncbi:VWA domain-containing protein [Salinibaculum rarum]|uniref:VWA domain-containing protein n=1 Tax=Salinibaculum rarum TaxID=3058903 RepID=UPI00265E48C3|nr:VWA domain-containing protein [Salinibaculum sp. KK48]
MSSHRFTISPNTDGNSALSDIEGGKHYRLRSSPNRKESIETYVSTHTPSKKANLTVILSDDAHTASVKQTGNNSGRPTVIKIPTREVEQRTTDIDREVFDKEIQYAWAIHEAGHILYTDQGTVNAYFENSDLHRLLLSGPPQADKGIHVKVWNAAEDAAIEEALRADKGENVAERLAIKNQNFINRLDEQEGERWKNLNIFQALPSASIDLGKCNTGFVDRVLDEDNDAWQFASEKDKELFLELLPSLREMLADVQTIGDPEERTGRIFEYLKEQDEVLREAFNLDDLSDQDMDQKQPHGEEGDDRQNNSGSAQQEASQLQQNSSQQMKQRQEQASQQMQKVTTQQADPDADTDEDAQQEEANGGDADKDADADGDAGAESESEADDGENDDNDGAAGDGDDAGSDAASGNAGDEEGHSDGDGDNGNASSDTSSEEGDAEASGGSDGEDVDGDSAGSAGEGDTGDTESESGTESNSGNGETDGEESASDGEDTSAGDNGAGGSDKQDADGDTSGGDGENPDENTGNDGRTQKSLGEFLDDDDDTAGGSSADSGDSDDAEDGSEDGNADGDSDGEDDEAGNSTDGDGGSEDIDGNDNEGPDQSTPGGDTGGSQDSDDNGDGDVGESDDSNEEESIPGKDEDGDNEVDAGETEDPSQPPDVGEEYEPDEDHIQQSKERLGDEKRDQQREENQLKQELENLAEALDGNDGGDGAGEGNITEIEFNIDDKESYSEQRWNTAVDESHGVTQLLKQRLEMEQRDEWNHGVNTGKPDTTRLHGVKTGSTNVMRRVDEGEQKDYSVVIVLDRSGSMRDRIETAEKSVVAFAKGLEDLGINVCIIDMFDNRGRLISPFDQDIDRAKERLMTAETDGGTPLHDPLNIARRRLELERGATFVLSVTDGQPHDEEAYREELRQAMMPVMGLTLAFHHDEGDIPPELDDQATYYDTHAFVHSPDDLSNALERITYDIAF